MVQNKWIGLLNLDKVQQLWPEHAEIFHQDLVDLQQIQSIDSVGCAFLVQWALVCRTRHKKLQLKNVSLQGQQLFALYGLNDFFDVSN